MNVLEIPIRVVLKVLKFLPIIKTVNVPILKGSLRGYKISIQEMNSYILGNYEIETIRLIEKLELSDIVALDIGAHIGYFSMLLERKHKAKVYAFEPMPYNVKKIKHYFELNKVKNVKIFEMALSNQIGELVFSNLEYSDVGNTYVNNSPIFESSRNNIKVKTNTLDNLLSENTISNPNILKIDVEGAELDVLKGAYNLLKTCKPIIFLSTHDIHVVDITKDCFEYLDALDYKLKLLITHKKGLYDFIAYPVELSHVYDN